MNYSSISIPLDLSSQHQENEKIDASYSTNKIFTENTGVIDISQPNTRKTRFNRFQENYLWAILKSFENVNPQSAGKKSVIF
jgi:hypothetical protein